MKINYSFKDVDTAYSTWKKGDCLRLVRFYDELDKENDAEFKIGKEGIIDSIMVDEDDEQDATCPSNLIVKLEDCGTFYTAECFVRINKK